MVAAAVALLLAGCIKGDPHRPVPVLVERRGAGIELSVHTCPLSGVRSVDMRTPQDPSVAQDDDPVVWSAAAPGGAPSAREPIQLGQAPPDWVERVALTAPLEPDRIYNITVVTDTKTYVTGLRPGRLDDEVLWDDRLRPRSDVDLPVC